jgi:glutamate-1-semialdehyde 2,1-aminomutase
MDFTKSKALQSQIHQIIPGGCHTYAKGDDQFPFLAPGFIARGLGCHVWDVDGNEFIEYGMGCRAVSLGHAFRPVVDAAAEEMQRGANFTRPAIIELQCAEEFLGMIRGAEMCKFSKDGSTATTAALKLARAATGRDRIALCEDHPFFSIHDWFIGTTGINGGIPKSVQNLSLTFKYNDLDSVRALFKEYPNQIACIILEPAKYEDPEDHFLHRVQELCQHNGAIFILDEMITGFRWSNGGAQEKYDIVPDMSTFGKALANGFSLSALAGKRDLLEASGIYHDRQRVFALSTTHGAETHAMAAGIATMRYYQQHPVIEVLERQGSRLANGIREVINEIGVEDYVTVIGKPCNLVFGTKDAERRPSQGFRCLLMQELIKRGVLGPSLVISYSHSDADVDHTITAFRGALNVYRQALTTGYREFLIGRESQTVYRDFNELQFQSIPNDSGSQI